MSVCKRCKDAITSNNRARGIKPFAKSPGDNEVHRRWRASNRSKGRCLSCSHKVLKGYAQCRYHLEMQRIKDKLCAEKNRLRAAARRKWLKEQRDQASALGNLP